MTPMASLLSSLGSVVTQVISWVGDVCAAIVAQPFLLLTVGFLVLGGTIGIVGRLLKRG